MTLRSSTPALALMPQCNAADVNPSGAVIPPSIRVICRGRPSLAAVASAEVAGRPFSGDAALNVASAMDRKGDQGKHHRVLAALPEERARSAVGSDLLRQPFVWNERETMPDKVGRRVRERADPLEACGGCTRDNRVNQPATNTH